MDERPEPRDGFTVLDGAALVLGAAVASVHIRDLVAARLSPLGWGLAWLTFTGLALTAAGPFLFLVRRAVRRQSGHPRVGDWLWGLFGLPWLLSAPVRPDHLALSGETGATAFGPLLTYGAVLWCCMIPVSILALGLTWRWLVQDRQGSAPGAAPSPSWTDRFGIALAVAWPLQWGFGLVVLG